MSAGTPRRIGGWLPQDQLVPDTWLSEKISALEETVDKEIELGEKPLHPIVQEFQALIENDAEIFMGFHQMFDQVPTTPPYDVNPVGKPQVSATLQFAFLLSITHLAILQGSGL